MSSAAVKKVLVYGGSGALGSALVGHFKQKQYWVLSVDFKANENANENILLNSSEALAEQEAKISTQLGSLLPGDQKLDAIMNVAGGWAGGNAASPEFLANSQLMWSQSVCSSLIAASLASKFLCESGCLTLAGAAPAIDSAATPGMIGYGLAKAAVHQLTKSLADQAGGLPKDAFVAAIAPITLDTPMNRKWMSKSDFSAWTKLSYVAEMFDKWICERETRPVNGSVVKLTTVKDETTLTFH